MTFSDLSATSFLFYFYFLFFVNVVVTLAGIQSGFWSVIAGLLLVNDGLAGNGAAHTGCWAIRGREREFV